VGDNGRAGHRSAGARSVFPGVDAFKLPRMKVVVLHPGEMGAAVAAVLAPPVFWVPEGRSDATRARAQQAHMTPTDAPEDADVILSICPPDHALAVARSVAGFGGLYVDANAISPETSRRVRQAVPHARFVDGGIIGPPPREPGTTRLYLTGEHAREVAALFAGTKLEPRIVTDASALKMVYAAWTKGSQALLLAARATARELGVEAYLLAEWEALQLVERVQAAQRARESKGWRWVGEMEEIADTFKAAGQPEGFHRAAAQVFRDS
jgi:3-hydroxyisobutyrate dehydrogenase-like beta-hydroxyacid dehydrogenase